ncbi:unnamed protein product [Paramecium pentaurelia]|uniref:Uncharacterized protein n=1 Tax=Paramecium pentaurelia TaxID=43138 RepID=A0A8S1WGS1_9CILI|nr:unnamed protein product [Paramecium pentaurelia]
MGITCSNQQNKNLNFKDSHRCSVEQIEPLNQKNKNQYANQEHECTIWNYHQKRWCLEKFQIFLTQQQEAKYIFKGQILRIEQLNDSFMRPQVLTNLEQIQYLQWCGNFGKMNLQKFGKWTANWRGKKMLNVGGYYSEDGSKQGIWKEITKNYCSLCKIYEIGVYKNNQKIGLWNYVYKNKKIGGGFFNSLSQKNGKWIELSEGFHINEQITFSCEYKNGQRVGIYEIWSGDYMKSNNKQIGGGLYLVRDYQIKSGFWVEISEGLNTNSKVTYHGEYKNGKRFGRWDIMYQNEKIGGGWYDENCDGIQQGNWVEIWNGFNHSSQVTYHGQYKNGKKIGQWDIMYQSEKIGGGWYDENFDGIQQGNWVEIWNGFNHISQVTYNGQYENGKKIGQWDIKQKKTIRKFQKVLHFRSNGQDNVRNDGIILENQGDILDGFNQDSQENTQNQKNTQVDQWVFRNQIVEQIVNKTIGGGSYGNGVKMGYWLDLWDGYNWFSEVTYYGQYNSGKKVGRWNILYQNKVDGIHDLKIGGGQFNETNGSIKFGIWEEIFEGFNEDSPFIYYGEYRNGIKYGRWDIFKINDQNTFELKSSVTFDDKGIQISQRDQYKIQFNNISQNIQFRGKNLFGNKIGRWDIMQGNEKLQ